METKESIPTPTVDGLPIVLPPHLTALFEKAERQLRDIYGDSPSVEDLIRVWLACATPWRITVEFESAILNLKRGRAEPNEEGIFDEDSFGL